jgi:hypothetical protein
MLMNRPLDAAGFDSVTVIVMRWSPAGSLGRVTGELNDLRKSLRISSIRHGSLPGGTHCAARGGYTIPLARHENRKATCFFLEITMKLGITKRSVRWTETEVEPQRHQRDTTTSVFLAAACAIAIMQLKRCWRWEAGR